MEPEAEHAWIGLRRLDVQRWHRQPLAPGPRAKDYTAAERGDRKAGQEATVAVLVTPLVADDDSCFPPSSESACGAEDYANGRETEAVRRCRPHQRFAH